MAKGRALLVGMNVCDTEFYPPSWDSALRFCESDAESVAEITAGANFENTILRSAEGTRDRVMQEIRTSAQRLDDGDTFMLFFSGHGSYLPDNSGEEANKRDETICLYDGQLIDDELYSLWQQFKPGVRVFLFTDSCHSGDMLRAGEDDDVPKGLADEAAMLIGELYPDLARQLREKLPPKKPVQASIVHIAGCHEDQQSFENSRKKHGRLTAALLDSWAEGNVTNFKDLHEKMFKIMPTKQKPEFKTLGPSSPRFDSEPPFTV